MAQQVSYEHVFTSNGYETVAGTWNVPWAGLDTEVCISPVHPMRLRAGFFNIGFSNNGCISMGGFSAVIGHFVQAAGHRGDRIMVRLVPAGP